VNPSKVRTGKRIRRLQEAALIAVCRNDFTEFVSLTSRIVDLVKERPEYDRWIGGINDRPKNPGRNQAGDRPTAG
jgi:hypothetical protein